ncbi:hypothetical protein DRW41_13895 [Neobacillus piezotolerans]|uniref:Lipoprotein n=1 Tax=Neobacillus piezotolerans TaxID=2259171 RepID=A0A3D8GPB4_9BACI|nr:DUF6612 family protein [Neobacillus piezotolerans]RDU36121.1 hypothetical protein DRW41_13895 [Neobacillus piezotolerans]
MRKILPIGKTILLLLLLAACTGNNDGLRQKATTRSISAEEVIAKADAAFENLDSLSVNLEIIQYIEDVGAGTKQKLSSVINMDLLTSPAAFHQTANMTNHETGLSQTSEAYYTTEEMFINDGTETRWKKVPDEQAALAVAASMKMNPAAELHKADGLQDILSMESTSREYIVTLKAAGNQHMDELKKIIMASMPSEFQLNTELLEKLNIKNFNYELAVNRKSFFPERFNAKAEIELSIAGNSVTMKQEMEGSYSNFNNIMGISVPDSVRMLAGD